MNDKQSALVEQLKNFGADSGKALKIKYNYPLSCCSTFRIGGNADAAAFPENSSELIEIYRAARAAEIPVFVAGNASNILFDDRGYRGLVLFTTGMQSISYDGEKIYAESGAMLTSLSVFAQKNSVSGFSFLYGIPGTVGGGLYMNCGAFGGEVSDILTDSTYYDPYTDKTVTISNADHEFGYRKSCYQNSVRIILSASFRAENGNAEEIRSEMEERMAYRREKQPLDFPSAGSVFKRYPGYYTSRLIEEAGLKGRSVGGACVSKKHAGFIVNLGGATSADVKELISQIKSEIYNKYGIHIECEIVFAPYC